MQETAFDASAAAGYDLARYASMGRHWLVRQTEIEYLHPLRYNDVVEVKTWIADIRRASSRRLYEFRLQREEDLAARAYTDWIFLDSTTNQPASVPAEMAAAFFPEGLPGRSGTRQPFPEPPPPPPSVFTTHRQVSWQDIDSAYHVNNTVYMNYVSDCAMQVVAAYGWPVQRLLAEGLAIVLRKHIIQYLQPALLDDEVEIASWAFDMRRSTAWRHYALRRVSDQAPLARVNSYAVWVNATSGVPVRIPLKFRQDFLPNLSPQVP